MVKKKWKLNLVSTQQRRKDYVKAKTSRTQQTRKCKLYDDREEMVNHNKRMHETSAKGV